VLCVALFLYLTYVARRAVDSELGEDGDADGGGGEERVPFIAGDLERRLSMAENPLRGERAVAHHDWAAASAEDVRLT
jgi:hypothetical protein